MKAVLRNLSACLVVGGVLVSAACSASDAPTPPPTSPDAQASATGRSYGVLHSVLNSSYPDAVILASGQGRQSTSLEVQDIPENYATLGAVITCPDGSQWSIRFDEYTSVSGTCSDNSAGMGLTPLNPRPVDSVDFEVDSAEPFGFVIFVTNENP